ncbi:hypothetical protein RYX36_033416, partial [Vicia faba]
WSLNGLGSHQTTGTRLTNNDESKDYYSTASTPKVGRINCIKNLRATEIKPPKSKFTKTLGTRSAQPKFKIKKEGRNGLLNENLYNRLKKNLFFMSEEQDGNDFSPNFHPSSNIGYEASDTGLVISEIFIPINDQDVQWYLLVIDFFDRDLVWLDSMPSAERHHFRHHEILFVSSTNVLMNEVVSKAAMYWDIQEKRRKALVKI